jgi:micrococcal nuclease
MSNKSRPLIIAQIRRWGINTLAVVAIGLSVAIALTDGNGKISDTGTTTAVVVDPGERISATVIKVFDGDTLLVLLNGVKTKVRLLGVDAPEKSGPYTTAEQGGIEAGKRLARLADNQTVTLEFGGDTRQDKYGRSLAHVFLQDGTNLNAAMIAEGYAAVYRRFNFTHKDDYLSLEKKAKAQKRGIWSHSKGK